jgi:hypothetical protein
MSGQARPTILSLFWILVGIQGCSNYFELHVTGSLESGIYFEVTDADRSRIAVPLRQLQVNSEDGNTILWHIKGEGDVVRLRYGVAPDGFEVVVEPADLDPARRYLVSANSKGWLSAPAGAAVLVEITPSGLAREVDRLAR